MSPTERRLWDLVRLPPVKWQQEPWGNEGGGFWVVGIIGMQVIWYNDIEDGFNVSRYVREGRIEEYWCNQDDLRDLLSCLCDRINVGTVQGKLGPPGPIEDMTRDPQKNLPGG